MTKILLVEDDKSLREIYGVRLLAEGYDIVSAGDGEEALAMAIKEKPGLIVSDVMMPKISGFDMLDILRSTTETRDIKVIMMTALSSDDQRARGEQLGADRYLVKSQVGIEDVVRTVHEVLGDSGVAAPAAPAPQAQPVSIAPQPSPVAAPAPVQEQAPTQYAAAPEASAQTVAELSTPEVAPQTSLPQPTAPFSSPRPATLGERVINPLQPTEPTGGTSVASQIEQELQAPTEPIVSSQVDDGAPIDTPAVGPFASPTTAGPVAATDFSQPQSTSATDNTAQQENVPAAPQQPPFPPQA
ncbi:response regulator [Candidatus Saccharibacteria bacterium]|nr:response regulator [Candidatus Saccharibacteria bacterium]